MRLSRRDLVATLAVGAAVVIYLLWAWGVAVPGGVRATGAVILGLGFLASASAVVPTFLDLLHGDRTYLVVTSTLGTLTAGAGVHLLVTASQVSLGIVMAAMVVMWLLATWHHGKLAEEAARQEQPRRTAEPAGLR